MSSHKPPEIESHGPGHIVHAPSLDEEPLETPAASGSRFKAAIKDPMAIAGFVILMWWIIDAVVITRIYPIDPLEQSFQPLLAPSGENWFGTDELGRDVLARTLAGVNTSLPYAIVLVFLAMIVGTILGALAGYFGKIIDEVIMRIADIVFAFPMIILAMVIAAALGPGLVNAAVAMLVAMWPSYARVTRSLVLSAARSEYVLAARLAGASSVRVLVRDILPNIVAPVLVLATLDIGTAVLLLSGLSFLGLGAVPPAPDWGLAVSSGVQYFSAWWIAVFPGLAIFSVVLAFNFIGDTLRDTLDPRTSEAVQDRAM